MFTADLNITSKYELILISAYNKEENERNAECKKDRRKESVSRIERKCRNTQYKREDRKLERQKIIKINTEIKMKCNNVEIQ